MIPTKFQPLSTTIWAEMTGPWLEQAFYYEVINKQPQFKREYLPGFWTDFENLSGCSNIGSSAGIEILEFLNSLDKNKKYFTLVQNDEGLQCYHPGNILVFGAGGVGDIPIPLWLPNTPIVQNMPRDHWVTFQGTLGAGSNRTGARGIMLEKLKYSTGFEFIPFSNRASYFHILQTSEFGLCPRGWGKTSARLYETMASGAIPIYIWDDMEWLPYKDVLDWSEFSISVNVSDCGSIPDRIQSCNIEKMRKRIIDIFQEYFTISGILKQVVRMVNL